jgi:hypothetical protein
MEKKSKKFTNNEKRSSRIQSKMEAEYGKPIIFYAYYATQADACKKLGVTPAEINKSIQRGGTIKGGSVIKGDGVTSALTLLTKINDIKKQNNK